MCSINREVAGGINTEDVRYKLPRPESHSMGRVYCGGAMAAGGVRPSGFPLTGCPTSGCFLLFNTDLFQSHVQSGALPNCIPALAGLSVVSSLFVRPSVRPSVRLSVCLAVCPSVRLLICHSSFVAYETEAVGSAIAPCIQRAANKTARPQTARPGCWPTGQSATLPVNRPVTQPAGQSIVSQSIGRSVNRPVSRSVGQPSVGQSVSQSIVSQSVGRSGSASQSVNDRSATRSIGVPQRLFIHSLIPWHLIRSPSLVLVQLV